MQFQQPFNASQVDPSPAFVVPAMADYHVQIVASEPKEAKEGGGGYLELTLVILDPGPYYGIKVPYRLNIFSKSEQTVKMSYSQLSAVVHACRLQHQPLQNSQQLWNIPFMATIGPQKDNPQYSNVFKVMDITGQVPGKGGAPAPALAPAPAAYAPPAAPAPAAWAPPGAPAPAPGPAAWAPPGAAPPAQAPAPAAWQPNPAANATPKAPWET